MVIQLDCPTKKVGMLASCEPVTVCAALQRLGRSRDEQAWTVILERHGADILRVTRRILIDKALAEDACHETLLQIRAHAGTFKPSLEGGDPEAAARAWILRIAATTALKLIRTRECAGRIEARAFLRNTNSGCPIDAQITREQMEQVRREIAELPDVLRDSVVLKFYGELDYPELSQALACSPEAARKRVQRGLERLRSRLALAGVAFTVSGFMSSLAGGGTVTAAQLTAAVGAEAAPTAAQIAAWKGVLSSTASPAFSLAAPVAGMSVVVKAALAISAAVVLSSATLDFKAYAKAAPASAPVVAAEDRDTAGPKRAPLALDAVRKVVQPLMKPLTFEITRMRPVDALDKLEKLTGVAIHIDPVALETLNRRNLSYEAKNEPALLALNDWLWHTDLVLRASTEGVTIVPDERRRAFREKFSLKATISYVGLTGGVAAVTKVLPELPLVFDPESTADEPYFESHWIDQPVLLNLGSAARIAKAHVALIGKTMYIAPGWKVADEVFEEMLCPELPAAFAEQFNVIDTVRFEKTPASEVFKMIEQQTQLKFELDPEPSTQRRLAQPVSLTAEKTERIEIARRAALQAGLKLRFSEKQISLSAHVKSQHTVDLEAVPDPKQFIELNFDALTGQDVLSLVQRQNGIRFVASPVKLVQMTEFIYHEPPIPLALLLEKVLRQTDLGYRFAPGEVRLVPEPWKSEVQRAIKRPLGVDVKFNRTPLLDAVNELQGLTSVPIFLGPNTATKPIRLSLSVLKEGLLDLHSPLFSVCAGENIDYIIYDNAIFIGDTQELAAAVTELPFDEAGFGVDGYEREIDYHKKNVPAHDIFTALCAGAGCRLRIDPELEKSGALKRLVSLRVQAFPLSAALRWTARLSPF